MGATISGGIGVVPDNVFALVSHISNRTLQFDLGNLSLAASVLKAPFMSFTPQTLATLENNNVFSGGVTIEVDGAGVLTVSSSSGINTPWINFTKGANTGVLQWAPTAALRILSLPDVTGTLAVLGSPQTFSAIQTFDSELAGAAAAVFSTDAGLTNKLIAFKDSSSGFSTTWAFSSALSANRQINLPDISGTLVFTTATQTVSNKTITPRVVSMADATSFTPTANTADMNTQTCTQVAGTLTANAPTGSSSDGQVLVLRIKCTNAQTLSWNGVYRGGTSLALPGATSGGGKTDYFTFRRHASDNKWDIMESLLGY